MESTKIGNTKCFKNHKKTSLKSVEISMQRLSLFHLIFKKSLFCNLKKLMFFKLLFTLYFIKDLFTIDGFLNKKINFMWYLKKLRSCLIGFII